MKLINVLLVVFVSILSLNSCENKIFIPMEYHKKGWNEYSNLRLYKDETFKCTMKSSGCLTVFDSIVNDYTLQSSESTITGTYELNNRFIEFVIDTNQYKLSDNFFPNKNKMFKVISIDSSSFLLGVNSIDEVDLKLINLINKSSKKNIQPLGFSNNHEENNKIKIDNLTNEISPELRPLTKNDIELSIINIDSVNKINYFNEELLWSTEGYKITLNKGSQEGIIKGLILHSNQLKHETNSNISVIVSNVKENTCTAMIDQYSFKKIEYINGFSLKRKNID